MIDVVSIMIADVAIAIADVAIKIADVPIMIADVEIMIAHARNMIAAVAVLNGAQKLHGPRGSTLTGTSQMSKRPQSYKLACPILYKR